MSDKTDSLSAILASARTSLEDDSWIDEITAPDEDGQPNDYARRVVPLDDVFDEIDRITAAAGRERRKYERLHKCCWSQGAVQGVVRQMLDAADDLQGAEPKESEDLRHFAGVLIDCGQTSPGNAAAMRAALVDILDRTNREKERDYGAALNGGILEIHDIANTALNQERAADALEWKKICAACAEGTPPERCAYYGEPDGCNAPVRGHHPAGDVAERLKDELADAHDAIARLEAELAEARRERDTACAERALSAVPGNAAALREALEKAHSNIKKAREFIAWQSREDELLMEAQQEIKTALAAPARNCDRLRGLVARLADNLSRYHLVGVRERALLREARAAIGEG